LSEKTPIPVYEYKGYDGVIKSTSDVQEGILYLYDALQSIIVENRTSLVDQLNQHTNYEQIKYKKKTLYNLFEDVSLLADYESSFVEQFSVHDFLLKKDEWEVRVRRQGHSDYRLSIDLRISPTHFIRICEMKGRDHYLTFLAEGNWIDGFYSFYQTFSRLLKEAKYIQFYTLRHKKEWSLPLEESVIPPVKTKKIEDLWNLSKALKEAGSPYVTTGTFDTRSVNLYHKDFYAKLTRWSQNDFTFELYVKFPQENRIKICNMYGINRKFTFRYEGIWEKYFVSFLFLLEEEYEKRQREKEEKIKKALTL
jgi:hypothetical protein